MRVAVVGLGGTGSAALRFLAQAGTTAVGFEQFGPGHTFGSSHGESRIIRYTYPDPFYTALMSDAYRLWHQLENASGEALLVQCGIANFGSPENPTLAAVERSLAQNGVPFEILTKHAAEARIPAVRIRDTERVLLQTDGGFLRAADCVRANLSLAQKSGAWVRWHTPVTSILRHGDAVMLRTQDGEEERFDRVLVCAGPWAARFSEELRLPLTVTRQEIYYVDGQGEMFAPSSMPVWIDFDSMWYGFPSDGRTKGVKIARHVPGKAVDPDHVDRTVTPQGISEAETHAAERLALDQPRVVSSSVCLYTSVPDEDFVIGVLPSVPGCMLVSGCSGHGFKFTVLLGRIAADLALTGRTAWDIGRFSPTRFRP
jgi:monomeric sarcosine oxidase